MPIKINRLTSSSSRVYFNSGMRILNKGLTLEQGLALSLDELRKLLNYKGTEASLRTLRRHIKRMSEIFEIKNVEYKRDFQKEILEAQAKSNQHEK